MGGGGLSFSPNLPPKDSKFTNNTDSNTLLEKFNTILQNDKNIVHLCFLIGFFRVSGFKILWRLISPKLTQLESINILVGIDADLSQDLSNLVFNPHHQKSTYEKFKREFCKEQSEDLNNSEYKFEVEESFNLLLKALKEQKLQIRIIKDKKTHAKFYIFNSNPIQNSTNTSYNGSLIVGSSNLSYNGLKGHYEFNLETKDSNDIAYALYEFNELWKDSILLDESEVLKKQIEEESYLKICTPEEIYYKLLIEYFGENQIKIDTSLKNLFPKNFLVLNYQLAAITEGLEKLEKYNGFFLSDVVGLGKTLIALIVAKRLKLTQRNFHIAIICPRALVQNWVKHLDLLDLKADVASYDKLDKIKQKAKDYSLIIIDESHNLANHLSNRHKNIQEICKTSTINQEKKNVILLSATPLRNSPQDIKNQLLLFQDERNANIEDVSNLEKFFAPLIKDFNDVKKELKNAPEKRQEAKEKLDNIASQIRNKLLRFVMIRRTRSDIFSIENFKDDLRKQELKFPTIAPPKDLNYNLDKDTLNLALQTLALLNNKPNDIGDFGYYRYLIYPNLKPNGQAKFEKHYRDKENFKQKAEQLQNLMQILLFKRFDSSFEAFKESLEVQIKSLQAFLKMFEKGKISIPKKQNNLYKFYDDILASEDGLELLLKSYEEKGNVIPLEIDDFKEDFEAHLKSDLRTLQTLRLKWQERSNDTKLKKLQDKLKEFKGKVIIFTEAKSSANYLAKKLQHLKVLKIDASNRDENYKILNENFDANFENKKDDYDILISTDTLAEGINLHRSNIIINYDSPWGITKLMQRIGRINRIGTKHEKIEIYNFKPTNLSDEILNFKQIAYQKLQSFHSTLGEDSAIYDEVEEFESKRLFEKIQNESDELSEDTEFLNDIQKLYRDDEAKFNAILKIKPKSRSFINDKEQIFCYLKNELGNSFFYALKENKVEESSFLQMARYLKNQLNTAIIKPNSMQIKSHYDDIENILKNHNAKNNEMLFNTPTQEVKINKNTNTKTRKAYSKITNYEFLSDEEKERIKEVLENGILKGIEKEIENAKTPQDYKDISTKCQDIQISKETIKTSLKTPQIQLSISTFHKE